VNEVNEAPAVPHVTGVPQDGGDSAGGAHDHTWKQGTSVSEASGHVA
jgi:hypothetical protein